MSMTEILITKAYCLHFEHSYQLKSLDFHLVPYSLTALYFIVVISITVSAFFCFYSG